jgi:hypothetical protein
MPGLSFSGVNLASVAYAEVDKTAGASTVMNSGVTTTRTSLGTYVVILPTQLAQREGTDIVLVTPRALPSEDDSGIEYQARDVVVDNSLAVTKTIYFWRTVFPERLPTATLIDTDFTVVILRSTITPPTGAPY